MSDEHRTSPAALTLTEFVYYVLGRYRELAPTRSHHEASRIAFKQAMQAKLLPHPGVFTGFLAGIERDDGLDWLRKEMTEVLKYLDQLRPRDAEVQIPETDMAYLRGLREMAQWVLEKCDHEISWQGLRSLFPGVAEIPEHGSSFVFRESEPQKEGSL